MSSEDTARAVDYLFDLFNDADHVRKLTENAQHALKHDRFAEAQAQLKLAAAPAARLKMRVDDALRAVGGSS